MSESSKDRLRFGECLGLNVGPIPIRLVLAVTFIWAGAGKFFAQDAYVGDAAFALYEMGVIAGPAGTEPTPDPVPPPSEDEGTNPAEGGEEGGRVGLVEPGPATLANFERVGSMRLVGQDETRYTAADFDEPIEMMRLYSVAVMVYEGANPGYEEGTSTPKRVIVPGWAANGKRPVVLAWAAGLTELVGGVLVLVGLLTRLSAVGLVGVMGTAAWLTVFGPAMQDVGATLGFLPTYDMFSYDWMNPLWLLALAGASASLVFTGAGSVSVHAFLFGSRAEADEDDYDDED
jgi:uncharacterized membrane protein YphA (DoxX/SURF4 family)